MRGTDCFCGLQFSLRVRFLIVVAVVVVVVVVVVAAAAVVVVLLVILKFISASFRHHLRYDRNHIEFGLEKEGLSLVILPYSYFLEQFFFLFFFLSKPLDLFFFAVLCVHIDYPSRNR